MFDVNFVCVTVKHKIFLFFSSDKIDVKVLLPCVSVQSPLDDLVGDLLHVPSSFNGVARAVWSRINLLRVKMNHHLLGLNLLVLKVN